MSAALSESRPPPVARRPFGVLVQLDKSRQRGRDRIFVRQNTNSFSNIDDRRKLRSIAPLARNRKFESISLQRRVERTSNHLGCAILRPARIKRPAWNGRQVSLRPACTVERTSAPKSTDRILMPWWDPQTWDWATLVNTVIGAGAGERDGASGGGGRRLSRGVRGKDARSGAAQLGDEHGQSRSRIHVDRRTARRCV